MQESLSSIESLVESLAGELALCEPDSDQGMVPLYSLLSELMESLKQDPEAILLCQPVQRQLSDLLDRAGVLTPPVISSVERMVLALQTAVRYWLMGLEVPWSDILPTAEQLLGTNGEVVAAVDGAEEDEADAGATTTAAVATLTHEDDLLVLPLDDNREILEEFYQEATEHLDSIEAALLELEEDATNEEAISSIFRSFHTIKGVAGFLDLLPMQRLAHEVETLLDHVRTGRISFGAALVSLVLDSRDRLQLQLVQVQEGLANGVQPAVAIPVSDLIEQTVSFLRPSGDGDEDEAEDFAVSAAVVETGPIAVADGARDMAEGMGAALQTDKARAAMGAGARATIRMDLIKLDSIIDAVGELVIVESQLRDSIQALGDMDSRIERNLAQLGRITRELQRSGLSLRMVSLKPTFQKMQRLARDLAGKCGKQVNFVVEGEDTEMDRSVVEEISDPLVHMIRNALDHGVETPQEREAAGKSKVGHVQLRAYYSGDSIVLELRDDGRGVNTRKVLAKAIERGLAQPDVNYSQEEIIAFLFHPGLSTAEKVSDVSGRGVGMDVVKTNIKKLRGRIEMRSEEGKGSQVRISLPLTMAIIDGLLIRVGKERLILPVSSVNMTLSPRKEQIFSVQGKGRVIKHREQIFRLVHLAKFFGIKDHLCHESEGVVVMVESDGHEFGLVLDEVLGKQEVVVKQLGSFLTNPDGISGGAILGDGTIALILDPGALGRQQQQEP